MQAITGNTYPVRRELRAMGGEWDAARKAWMVPDEKADEARLVMAGVGGPDEHRMSRDGRRNYRKASRYGSNYTRFSSGAEVYTNKRGRCEDAPCCGCCS